MFTTDNLELVGNSGQKMAWSTLMSNYSDLVTGKLGKPYPLPFLLLPDVRLLIEESTTIESAIIYELFFVTGGRLSEILELLKGSFILHHEKAPKDGEPRNHIILHTNRQRNTNRREYREVDIDYPLVPRLRQWFGSQNLRAADKVFKVSPRTVQRWLTTDSEKQPTAFQVPITPYTLRHSSGVHLALLGYDVSFIQNRLGHVDISSSKAYLDISRRLVAGKETTPIANFSLV